LRLVGLVVFSLLFLASCAGAFALWRKHAFFDKRHTSWQKALLAMAGSHTQVAGVLAGFSITIVVLIATQFDLASLRGLTFGMFVVSFFGYVATAISFSVVGGEAKDERECFLFSAASVLYYLSTMLSFCGLLLLLGSLDLEYLNTPLSILLSAAAIGGYVAVFNALIDLLKLNRLLYLLPLIWALSITGICLSLGLFSTQLHELESTIKIGLFATAIVVSLVFLACMLVNPCARGEIGQRTGLTILALIMGSIGTLLVFFLSALAMQSLAV